jgi:hypothetical protein
MNNTQKEQVARLRAAGFGYMKIAKALSLSDNTVKSYCQRHNLAGVAAKDPAAEIAEGFCKECGLPLKEQKCGRKKKFCSDSCRMKWWNSHLNLVQRKAIHTSICAFCGKTFENYGSGRRKFCCRACYANAKRKDGGDA